MRIRKRKVPLPLSLLSPIPLSDPHLFSRSPVMLLPVQAAASDHTSIITTFHSQPSDHFTLTFPDNSASDLRRLIVHNSDMGVEEEEDEGALPTSNDEASNTSITTASIDDDNTNNNGSLLSLSNNTDYKVGRWCDGDKAIPLKKRREVMKKGNNKRGNTIMEGSRCSRVNGRGWRCCQPTLVGYSLCEHHLGKGRLRSITTTSVKPRTAKKKTNLTNNGATNSFALGRDERQRGVVDDDEKKSSFGNNKRVKLGVVKARSLSSLLGQTNTMSFVGDHATIEHHDNKLITNLDHQ